MKELLEPGTLLSAKAMALPLAPVHLFVWDCKMWRCSIIANLMAEEAHDSIPSL